MILWTFFTPLLANSLSSFTKWFLACETNTLNCCSLIPTTLPASKLIDCDSNDHIDHGAESKYPLPLQFGQCKEGLRFILKFTVNKPRNKLAQTCNPPILRDPGADSGDEGKSKRAEKCGTKKSKERREEPLETMSYQTSSKRSPFWLLIGARKTQVFWHQSEARTGATVWN